VKSEDYSIITETPGVGATAEQLSAIYTRYHFAARHAAGKDVLEVACGVGNGLGYLARFAQRVVGGDIEDANVQIAQDTYRDDENVEIHKIDAHRLPFPDRSFDLLLLFEALYYLEDAEQFMSEVFRVLRPGGKLLLSTVHPSWPGFNPSPLSRRYYTSQGLRELAQSAGLVPTIYAGFEATPQTLLGSAVGLLRRVAVRFRLVPRSMRGKTLLKRLFYGQLKPIPRIVDEFTGALEPLRKVGPDTPEECFKFLYMEAQRQSAKFVPANRPEINEPANGPAGDDFTTSRSTTMAPPES
jgi:SAM-dependent methyltransferase